jgi:hypothetical protein
MLALTALFSQKSRSSFSLKKFPSLACLRFCAKRSVVDDAHKADGALHLQGRMSQDIGSHGLQITLILSSKAATSDEGGTYVSRLFSTFIFSCNADVANRTSLSSFASSREHQEDFDGSVYPTRANNVWALWYRSAPPLGQLPCSRTLGITLAMSQVDEGTGSEHLLANRVR